MSNYKNKGSTEAVRYGAYVRKHRIEKGMTQQELGEIIGITAKSIGFIERGENFPTQVNMFKLAEVLDMSMDEFIYGYKFFDAELSIQELNEMLKDLSPQDQTLMITLMANISKALKQRNDDRQS